MVPLRRNRPSLRRAWQVLLKRSQSGRRCTTIPSHRTSSQPSSRPTRQRARRTTSLVCALQETAGRLAPRQGNGSTASSGPATRLSNDGEGPESSRRAKTNERVNPLPPLTATRPHHRRRSRRMRTKSSSPRPHSSRRTSLGELCLSLKPEPTTRTKAALPRTRTWTGQQGPQLRRQERRNLARQADLERSLRVASRPWSPRRTPPSPRPRPRPPPFTPSSQVVLHKWSNPDPRPLLPLALPLPHRIRRRHRPTTHVQPPPSRPHPQPPVRLRPRRPASPLRLRSARSI